MHTRRNTHVSTGNYSWSVHGTSLNLGSLGRAFIYVLWSVTNRTYATHTSFCMHMGHTAFYRAVNAAAISSNYEWVSICYLHTKEHKQQSTEGGSMRWERRGSSVCPSDTQRNFSCNSWSALAFVLPTSSIIPTNGQRQMGKEEENKDREQQKLWQEIWSKMGMKIAVNGNKQQSREKNFYIYFHSVTKKIPCDKIW